MSNFQLCDSFHKVGFLRAVCGECGGVWGRVVRGVCCWGVECDGGRFPLDGLKAKKLPTPVVVKSPCGVPYWYFFCCYAAVTP